MENIMNTALISVKFHVVCFFFIRYSPLPFILIKFQAKELRKPEDLKEYFIILIA